MNTVKNLWEKRSEKFGRQLEGVLIKSIPRVVNLYFDQWTFEQAKLAISPNLKLKVLDLGCAYGRLSKELLDYFPKIQTTGVDIAKNYIKLYNEDLNPRGRAIAGDIQNLKLPNNSFDVIIMVVTLIYLNTSEKRQRCLKEVFRVLKPGGKFVLIEKNILGNNIITLGGLVSKIRGKKNREIPAVCFTHKELSAILEQNGGIIKRVSGIPFWTLFLHFSIVFALINKNLCLVFLRIIKFFDNLFSFFYTPSVYISYIVEKRDDFREKPNHK